MTKFTFATAEEGFDSHIDQSVRGYSNLWNDVLKFSEYFVEDGTTRGTAAESWTVTLLTAGQSAATQVPLPEGATALVYSRGSVPATTLGMLEKGFTTVTAASKTTYTAVPGDQIGVDTVANIVTITLPAGAVGDEIVIMDVSASNGFGTNKCVVAPNGSEKIQGVAASLTVSVERAGFTLVYSGSSQGWLLKDK